MQRRTSGCIPCSSRFSAAVSEEPIELDGEAKGMHELMLQVPNLPRERQSVEELGGSHFHQVGISILVLLEPTGADVDVGGDRPVESRLII